MFKVGDRVKAIRLGVMGIVINVSDYRPPEMRYAVELDGGWDDYYFCGEGDIAYVDE